MFAEVALPLNVSQTYTYRLPGDMVGSARPGCRVVVPFGKKLLTAFIVGIHEQIDDELRDSLKNVEELIDDTPVVHADILELTKWMSDYYYAPWGECLRSALPAGTLAATERFITITEAGRAAIPAAGFDPGKRSAKDTALELLAKSGTLSGRELEEQTSKSGARQVSVPALVRRLERAGYIRITQRVGESRLRPRLQNVVRLVTPANLGQEALIEIRDETSEDPVVNANNGGEREHGLQSGGTDARKQTDESRSPRGRRGSRRAAGSGKKLSEQQRRVIDQLAYKGEPVPLGELLEAAGTWVSAVRTLEKRGIVEVFAREVRRDSLGHIEIAAEPRFVQLTSDQQQALDLITQKLDEQQYSTFLLHGVTGSGKTEIYIRAMGEALTQGRT